MTGTARIIQGDARQLPLPDNSVDLICTSPPYFALRSYTDGGEHYDGQIGSETTPAEFLDALLVVTRECMRVLKPQGSLFVNLGDKYADKSLMGMPWRYALACIDQLGLILRAEIIWSKPNGLPESVQDRVRRSHEQWFHFTLQPRYYAAVDEIREPQEGGVVTNGQAKRGRGFGGDSLASGTFSKDGGFNAYREERGINYNPLGKLPGSVWTIPSQPLVVPPELGVDHFAAYPMEWPRRIIQGWTPNGICVECGEGRRPAANQEYLEGRKNGTQKYGGGNGDGFTAATAWAAMPSLKSSVTITGYICGCPEPTAPTAPAVVLDPFGGTGTTALIAKALGRTGISIDLSADYCRLAEWRCNDPAQLAQALQVEKPEPIPDGQMSLFGDAL